MTFLGRELSVGFWFMTAVALALFVALCVVYLDLQDVRDDLAESQAACQQVRRTADRVTAQLAASEKRASELLSEVQKLHEAVRRNTGSPAAGGPGL